MSKLEILIPRQDIEEAVIRLAEEISGDYRDKNPLVLGVLKGSFIFMADLVRQLDFPIEIDFLALSSYKDQITSRGEISVVQHFDRDITDRHILVVEDIIDTGLTVRFLMDRLHSGEPAQVRLCALLEKPSRRAIPLEIDYLGFVVPDRFVVGYGLDCAEKYRNLPDICCIAQEDSSQ